MAMGPPPLARSTPQTARFVLAVRACQRKAFRPTPMWLVTISNLTHGAVNHPLPGGPQGQTVIRLCPIHIAAGCHLHCINGGHCMARGHLPRAAGGRCDHAARITLSQTDPSRATGICTYYVPLGVLSDNEVTHNVQRHSTLLHSSASPHGCSVICRAVAHTHLPVWDTPTSHMSRHLLPASRAAPHQSATGLNAFRTWLDTQAARKVITFALKP